MLGKNKKSKNLPYFPQLVKNQNNQHYLHWPDVSHPSLVQKITDDARFRVPNQYRALMEKYCQQAIETAEIKTNSKSLGEILGTAINNNVELAFSVLAQCLLPQNGAKVIDADRCVVLSAMMSRYWEQDRD
jgi:hypothetical protein